MTQAEGPLNKSTILGLAAMALAVLVVANDFTALSVALPAMEQEFGADVTTVQWVINGYALVFGVLIVTGGRLADMFGRRRIFFLGASIFAVFSVIGGFAPNVGMLLLPGSDGCRRRHDVAGHPGHDLRDLAPEQSGLSRRTDSGCGRFRQRDWTPYWWRPHRRAQLAMDLLPEPSHRCVRDAGHLARRPRG